uniref:Uncharacterized protein n=2 Tax=Chrysotila carterae TaxID=13221 RepID=A0A7S4BGA4_CHRCT
MSASTFLSRVANMSEPPFRKSQHLAEADNNGPVKLVSANTHNSVVTNPAKDVLICLHYGEVPHSLALVAMLFSDVVDIDITAFDLSANDPDLGIYPPDILKRAETFYLYPADPMAKMKPIRYAEPHIQGQSARGGRQQGAEPSAIADFVLAHGKARIEPKRRAAIAAAIAIDSSHATGGAQRRAEPLEEAEANGKGRAKKRKQKIGTGTAKEERQAQMRTKSSKKKKRKTRTKASQSRKEEL